MMEKNNSRAVKLALVNITKDLECPPLTLVYLATYLKKHLKNRIKIKIVDINFEDPSKTIMRLKPDIVGISSMTIRYNYAKRLVEQLKKHADVPVILGGVHISTCPESFSKVFDIAVRGEGEKTILELIELFEKRRAFPVDELKKIKGIMFWDNSNAVRTEAREMLDLKEIPVPDRDYLNPQYFWPRVSYNKIRGKKVIEAGMLTSRGCPYRCVFCSTSLFWNKIRFQAAEKVAKEIKYLITNFKVNYIVMYDDFFAITEDRATEIYNAMKKESLIGKVRISCSLRANLVTDKLCSILRKIGVVTANFGFESGSNRILQYLKAESVTVEQNKNAVRLCRKHGFDVTGSFMMGNPGEKMEDMQKTLELMGWMQKKGVIDLWCGVAKPYPATKFWEYGIKNNLIDENFNFDLVDPSYIHNPVFLDKSISKEEFFRIFREAKYISFSISNKNESRIARKIKDFVYYNKILCDIAKFMAQRMPDKITERMHLK